MKLNSFQIAVLRLDVFLSSASYVLGLFGFAVLLSWAHFRHPVWWTAVHAKTVSSYIQVNQTNIAFTNLLWTKTFYWPVFSVHPPVARSLRSKDISCQLVSQDSRDKLCEMPRFRFVQNSCVIGLEPRLPSHRRRPVWFDHLPYLWFEVIRILGRSPLPKMWALAFFGRVGICWVRTLPGLPPMWCFLHENVPHHAVSLMAFRKSSIRCPSLWMSSPVEWSSVPGPDLQR